MKQLVLITCLAISTVLSDAVSAARAEQMIGRDPLEWEATLDFEGAKRKIRDRSANEFDIDEGVRVRQSGFILDPRIATFTGTGHIVFEQGRSTLNIENERRNGVLANYNTYVSLLHGTSHWFSLMARASRDSGTLDTNLGSRSKYINKNREAAVYFKNRFFPAHIRYSERHQDTNFRSAFSNFADERRELLRRIAFNGRSSKLDVSLEHDWFDDKIEATDRDFTETRALANHSAKWGRGSRLSSRILYWDRRGFRQRKRFNVDEVINLQHSSKLQSFMRYRYNQLEQETKSSSHTGSLELAHGVFRNLTTRTRFYGSWIDADTRKETDYEARFEVDYDKQELFKYGGDMTTNFAIGYGVTDRESTAGFSETVGEQQTVPSSGIILLERRFIDTATIIVTDDTGTLVYSEGSDYTLFDAAENFTQLNIVFGGQISVGQEVLIDYQFETLPSVKFSRIPYEFYLRIDIGRITLTHRMNGEEQTLKSGRDSGILLDRKDITSAIEIRFERPATRATLSAERRVLDTGAFSSKSFNLRQTFFHQLSRKISINVAAGEDFIRSSGRTIRLYTADARLNWTPANGLIVRPFMIAWIRRDHGSELDLTSDVDETFTSAGLEVTWQVRKLKLRARYNHDNRSGTRIDTSEDRLMFHLVRKF